MPGPRLYIVDVPEVAGSLAISTRPAGLAELDAEVAGWRSQGVDIVVSLLPAEEAFEAGLATEADVCAAHGITMLSVPIEDFGTPSDVAAIATEVERLADALRGGRNIAFHCFAGLGRSPSLAACTLIAAGLAPNEAIARISAARGVPVPETPGQRRWILAFAERWRSARG